MRNMPHMKNTSPKAASGLSSGGTLLIEETLFQQSTFIFKSLKEERFVSKGENQSVEKAK